MWEVFNTATAATVEYVRSEARAASMIEGMRGWDYDRAPAGYYVVDMGGRVVARHDSSEGAARDASMRNMGSDYNSYSVVKA